MRAQDIIIRPVLTEKTYAEIANKRYTFEVLKTADKTAIKNAVEELFKVQVAKVNTLNVRGKYKSLDRGRTHGFTPSFKKAVVILKNDSKSIEFFDSLAK